MSLRQVSVFATDGLLLSRVPAHRTRENGKEAREKNGKGEERKGRKTGGEGAMEAREATAAALTVAATAVKAAALRWTGEWVVLTVPRAARACHGGGGSC